jgi:hypothetical protein
MASSYSPTSNFASCPAATGEVRLGTGCPTYPDTAHRCAEKRSGPNPTTAIGHTVHTCTCGYAWISSTAPKG